MSNFIELLTTTIMISILLAGLGYWGLSQSYLVAKSLSKSEALNPWQIF